MPFYASVFMNEQFYQKGDFFSTGIFIAKMPQGKQGGSENQNSVIFQKIPVLQALEMQDSQ